MTSSERIILVSIISLCICNFVSAVEYRWIGVPDNAAPALRSAALILAEKLGLPDSTIRTVDDLSRPQTGGIILTCGDTASESDGYTVTSADGGTLIRGDRPRALLYAAGDLRLWRNRTEGVFERHPDFITRSVEYHGSAPMAEYVAELGLNLLIDRKARYTVTFKDTLPEIWDQLTPDQQRGLERSANFNLAQDNPVRQACHDADIVYSAFLYGNDLQRWSGSLYEAAIKAYPQIKGRSASNSWELGTLCPSEPMTWRVIDAYLREYLQQTRADVLYVTFWDNYGLYCQCDRCRANGLNTFPNELYECVKPYHKTVSALGKKMIVRTWSSGVPHWLRDQWVNAPGYDHLDLSGTELWSRVIHDLPADIILQTKVYHADCQPNARFSTLLGQAGPHTEIAEYQMTGQTTGRYYFPAATVTHTAWTMKKSHDLVGPAGGVNLFLGGTRQSNYYLLDDICNSINTRAWRELSWDVNADLDKIWQDWTEETFGPQAAPYLARALRLSETAVDRTFSTLGMGSSTNSDFVSNIARRETLLMYTNRHFLPEYARYLEPNLDNVRRVIDEKEDCLDQIRQMLTELEKARPYLKENQYQELATRFRWLQEFAIIKRYLEEALWRFRYIRQLAAMRTTDPEQMGYIVAAYDQVMAHRQRLFEYDPDLKFSCYDTTLGQLRTRPALGSPVSLMKEIYQQSRTFIEEFVGPHYLPEDYLRD